MVIINMQSGLNSAISVTPVILCGGSGARLWPLSRAGFPKQFLTLSENRSLFQQALDRVNAIPPGDILVNETIIVTGEEHRFIALEQLREIQFVSAKLLLEPESKNTAPALTFAALQAICDHKDPILLVTPADQTVNDSKAFIDAIVRGIKVADSGAIVVLGIKPTSAETGFGYIKQKGLVGISGEFDVEKFVEKPNLEIAKNFFALGEYSWNGGIFIVRASVWIKAISTFRKDILCSTQLAFEQSSIDHQFVRPDPNLFKQIPNESIDCSVIEKCPGSEFSIKIIPLEAGWNDLGSWDRVWEAGDRDQNGNLIKGDTIIEDSKNNLIYADHRLVSTIGVNDLVIIETADVVMVANLSQSQYVKKIVSQLLNKSREEHELHRKVSRPWGWYDTIDAGENFKVKRIQVNPGASLSLQKHECRAEHWVVIKGVAEITNGDKVSILSENHSTYIPIGEIHRLYNPGDTVLEIIEVQSGSYLGEDDILRLEDTYGRCD